MIKVNRTMLALGLIAMALIGAIAWSLSFLVDAGDDVDRAAADASMTQTIAQHIQSKRPADLKNNSVEQLASQLPRILDSAMKSAEIEAEHLDRISPQAARPLGQSSLSETQVQLVLEQLSLRQTLLFVTALTQDHGWLKVHNLHMAHPVVVNSPGINPLWNVEITVSYLATSTGSQTAAVN